MSVSAIAALLQSALLLLAMAQSAPSLPQSFRDNAVSVAHQAISEATAALAASSTSPTASIVSTTNQTFTTPSGAVIGAGGNVVSVPASATPSLSIQISTTTAQGQSYSSQVPIQPTNPAFGSVLKTVQQGSIHVEWDTGIPTESKIFFSVVGGSTRIIPSESGNSTHHIADITGLTQGTHYAYTIEAIAGEQDQKVSGTWRIFCATAGGCVVLSN